MSELTKEQRIEFLKIKMAVLEAIPVDVDIDNIIAALAAVMKMFAVELLVEREE